ncbi:hypothetical protein [Nocardia harenae]|uniref:hypothetical protein n=1 Tax=Nocardia harenae TaxID=358707 RepID=UPI000829AA99|nr:hypothetical protein [Nocardia harenae]
MSHSKDDGTDPVLAALDAAHGPDWSIDSFAFAPDAQPVEVPRHEPGTLTVRRTVQLVLPIEADRALTDAAAGSSVDEVASQWIGTEADLRRRSA